MSKFLTPFLSFVLFILNVFCVSESMMSNCWNWCRVMTDDANFDQSGIILADFNLVHRRHWPFEILITEMWYSLVLYLHDLINEMRYVKIITYRYDIHFSSEKSNKKNRKKISYRLISIWELKQSLSQLTFTCLKSTVETLEKSVKYVQS